MTIDLDKFHKDQLELPLTFKQLQDEHKVWSKYNFDSVYPDSEKFWMPVFGVMEELGELCHALLKKAQGIRGTSAQHDKKAKDAVADITVFLASTCSALGFDWQEIIEAEWPNVRARDYKKDVALKTDIPIPDVTFFINGAPRYVNPGTELTYKDITSLAYPESSPEITWTIVASWKGSNEYESGARTVTPGQTIKIVDKMRIEVVHTGNA